MDSSLHAALILTALALLGIGVYILISRQFHHYSRPFLFFVATVFIGILAIYAETMQSSVMWSIGYVLLFFFLSFMPYAWYSLCGTWVLDQRDCPRQRKLFGRILLALSILFFILQLILRGIDVSLINNRWFITLNGWRLWYGGYFIISLAAGIYAVETTFRSALGLSREKITKSFFLLLACAICFLTLATIGFIYGQISDWILTFTFILITLICLLLARHYRNFMAENDGIVLTRKGVYSSVAIVLLGIYFLAVGTAGEFLVRFDLNDGLFFTIVAVILSIVTFLIMLFSQVYKSKAGDIAAKSTPYREDSVYGAEWKEFAEEVSVSMNIDSIVERTRRLLHRLLKVEDCFFVIQDPAPSDNFSLYSGAGPNRGIAGNHVQLLNEWLYRFGHPLEVATLREKTEKEYLQLAHLSESVPFPIFLLVPLTARQQFLGFWGIGSHGSGRDLNSEEIAFIEAAASPLALTILGARMTDELLVTRELESYHRFSSFVLHDLKNSVGMLSMLLQNAEKNMDDPEFQKEAMLTIGKAVERQKKIISRLTEDKPGDKLNLQPNDLRRLIALTLTRVRIDSIKSIDLIFDIPDGIAIVVDEEKIGSVFDNLIMNAVEAMPEGGKLRIELAPESQSASLVGVAFKDTGCGMDEEFIATRLFKPFISTKKHGLGIGMYQSREIIRQHQGRFDIVSKPGDGTTFIVFIPKANR